MKAVSDQPAYDVLTAEATRITEKSIPTLRAWERRGVIHPIRTSGGVRLYNREELERVAAERREKTNSAARRFRLPMPRATATKRSAPDSDV